ncbi:hypothetical protein [Lacticaseibacillus zhaodongensis]|uniref:hypothetical protein n=1 Tax=Lacticaseibacillus zhaodongensis TaxID=2668065 RepID=UPI0012D324A2|nr:hypothetical protein [Lacticaseibacillus zhaodongensis]
MDGIGLSLRTAQSQHLLINIYQRDADDFYTGYVQAVADDGVVLHTYNDAGLADGSAFVAMSVIDSIEVAGADIDTMTYRMVRSEEKGFTAVPVTPLRLPLNVDSSLLYQVAENMRRTGQVVMAVTMDTETYLEGQITAVAEDSMQLDVFNKFNYSDHRSVQVDFSNLCALEYEGYDLFLETALMGKRAQLRHLASSRYRNVSEFRKLFGIAQQAKQLLAITTRVNNDNFFVGRVQAVTNDFVVLALLDMAGQFGGYSLIRLRNINAVITDSDYLQTVSFYETWALQHHFVQAPLLNREREFDTDDDVLRSIVAEAEIIGRVLRVRSAAVPEAITGSVVDVGDDAFTVIPLGAPASEGTRFKYVQVLDASFDSIYSYLQEEWLRDNDKE